MGVRHPDSVFEQQEYRGQWWYPETPQRKVEGRLIGSEADGFRLSVSASLMEEGGNESGAEKSLKFALMPAPAESPLFIHGLTSKGEVTLYDSFRIKRQASHTGIEEHQYYSKLIVKGALINSADKLRFGSIRVKYSRLCNWLDDRVFKADYGNGLSNLRIGFSFTDMRHIYEDEHIHISLINSISGPGNSLGQNKVVVEWEPQFKIESKSNELRWEGSDHWNVQYLVSSINQFLSVATYSSSYPYNITGRSKQYKPLFDDGKTHIPLDVELYRETNTKESAYDERNEIIAWKNICDDPSQCLSKWFALHRSIPGPLGLFVASISSGNKFSPERFMNMISALEGLHRHANPDASKPTEAHSARLTSVLASTDNQHKAWLEEKLKYSYEPSLRSRLKDLMNDFNETIGWLLVPEGTSDSSSIRRKVIHAIVESRNALAHGLPEVGKDPGMRYYMFTIIAEYLMAIWLMRYLGIPDDRIKIRITNNHFAFQVRGLCVDFIQSELL